MQFVVIGISHKASAVEIREKFFLRPLERELLLSELKSNPAVVETFVLSTCNRTEIYANVLDGSSHDLFSALFGIKKIKISDSLKSHFYIKDGEESIEHLFKVTCGLDSLVIGEKQILGQVREAIKIARSMGMIGKVFSQLTNMALQAGKQAQTETAISVGGSSVSWAAVEMAQKTLGTLEAKKILIIGSGKMSHLTVEQLARKSTPEVFVMNRTEEKAQDLADKINGQVVSFWDIKNVLREVDVCICSVGAPHYLIDHELVKKVMELRNDKPLLLIDISTPRNIDPRVNLVNGVELFSIDSLQKVVDETIEKRHAAIDAVKQIVQRKISVFFQRVIKMHQRELISQLIY